MLINADDYGKNSNVNRAIADCFAKNYIDRATVMTNMPGYYESVQIAEREGFKGKIGLHLTLTEGKPLTTECQQSELCDENGDFHFYFRGMKRLIVRPSVQKIIEKECRAQIEKYLTSGFTLMHIDSHHSVHIYPSVLRIVSKLAREYGFQSMRFCSWMPNEKSSVVRVLYRSYTNGLVKSVNQSIVSEYVFTSDYIMKHDVLEFGSRNAELYVHPEYTQSGELIDCKRKPMREILEKIGNRR